MLSVNEKTATAPALAWAVPLTVSVWLAAGAHAGAQLMEDAGRPSGSSQGQFIYIRGTTLPSGKFKNYMQGSPLYSRSGAAGKTAPGKPAGPAGETIKQAQEAEKNGQLMEASRLYAAAARARAKGGGPPGVSELSLLSRSAMHAITAVERAQQAGKNADAMKMMKESEPVFDRLVHLDPNNSEWPYRLGVILAAGNRYADAQRFFSVALTDTGGSELYRKKARKKLDQLATAQKGFGLSDLRLSRW